MRHFGVKFVGRIAARVFGLKEWVAPAQAGRSSVDHFAPRIGIVQTADPGTRAWLPIVLCLRDKSHPLIQGSCIKVSLWGFNLENRSPREMRSEGAVDRPY